LRRDGRRFIACPAVYANVKGYFTNTTAVDVLSRRRAPRGIYVTERLMDIARPRSVSTGGDSPAKSDPEARAPLQELARAEPSIPATSSACSRTPPNARTGRDSMAVANSRSSAVSCAGSAFSYYMEASGGPPVVEPSQIRFKDDGIIEVIVATQSNGQGHETVFAQLLSDRLAFRMNA